MEKGDPAASGIRPKLLKYQHIAVRIELEL